MLRIWRLSILAGAWLSTRSAAQHICKLDASDSPLTELAYRQISESLSQTISVLVIVGRHVHLRPVSITYVVFQSMSPTVDRSINHYTWDFIAFGRCVAA